MKKYTIRSIVVSSLLIGSFSVMANDFDQDNQEVENTTTLSILPMLPREIIKKITLSADFNTLLNIRICASWMNDFLIKHHYYDQHGIPLNPALKVTLNFNNFPEDWTLDNSQDLFQFLNNFPIRGQITDDELQYLRGVHTIKLRWHHNITDRGLEYIAGVHTINLRGCINITDRGLKYLAGVHTINLAGCRNITDRGLEYIAGVRSIDLRGCINIPN